MNLHFKGDSSLKCCSHIRFCKATNLYLDLRKPRRSHERSVQFENTVFIFIFLNINEYTLKVNCVYAAGTKRTSFRQERLVDTANSSRKHLLERATTKAPCSLGEAGQIHSHESYT